MKETFVVYGLMGWNNVASVIARIVGDAFATGLSVDITVSSSDKPTDLMRKKWHAMCGDLAKQVPHYNGAKMDLPRWKAICMGVAIEQEWLPAWGGRGVVPFRKSSENLTKKQYRDCIEVAYMIGAHFKVVWSDPKHRREEKAA